MDIYGNIYIILIFGLYKKNRLWSLLGRSSGRGKSRGSTHNKRVCSTFCHFWDISDSPL